MAIVQGSNTPIVLEFDDEVMGKEISVGLYTDRGVEIKHWNKEDCTIDGAVITCPLTQEETKNISVGHVYLEVKILTDEDNIIFYDRAHLHVTNRFDREVVL